MGPGEEHGERGRYEEHDGRDDERLGAETGEQRAADQAAQSDARFQVVTIDDWAASACLPAALISADCSKVAAPPNASPHAATAA